MSRFKYCMVILTVLSLVPMGWADRSKVTSTPLRLAIELVDGSHIRGCPSIQFVPIQTPYARLDLPLQQINRIEMDDDHEKASLEMRNGDHINGVINLEPFELETVFGRVSVGVEYLRTVEVLNSGGTLTAEEIRQLGLMGYAGLNWHPWRVGFRVDDKRVSTLPRPREGFRYGHSGHGRDAIFATHIGDKNWTDYVVDLEFHDASSQSKISSSSYSAWYGSRVLFAL